MLKRRNKFLAIGLATVGVIGAGSVAFATWLVGVQQTERNVQLNVLVDSVEDSSIKLTAKLTSEELKVAETTAYDNSTGNAIIGSKEGNQFDAKALKFNFSELQVAMEKGSSKEIDNVKITCVTNLITDLTANNKIQSKTGEGTQLANHRTEATSLSYIALNEITIPGTDFKQEGSNGIYKFDANTSSQDDNFKFTWGTFFGGKSPVNYYNEIYSDGTTGNWTGFKDIYTEEELDKQHANIITELKGMDTYFKKLKTGEKNGITLKVKLNLKEKTL